MHAAVAFVIISMIFLGSLRLRAIYSEQKTKNSTSKPAIEPAGDYVLAIDSLTDTTILDGIEMPDNIRQKEMIFGTIVFVGPDASRTNPEDLVAYGPYAGKSIIMHGTQFRILRQGQIEAYIRRIQ